MENENGISRRSFIKGVGGIAAAATVMGLSPKTAKGQLIPRSITLPKETLIQMYERMLRIRKGELKLLEVFLKNNAGRSTGGWQGMRRTGHSSEGEEATCVGVAMAMKKGDYLTGSHRSHGYPLALGLPMRPWMGELFSRTSGTSRGRVGSLHIAEPALGILGMSGTVGAGVPLAVGAAKAIKLKGTDQVAVSTCGDGAMNTAGFNSSLNLAGIWKVPIVFVINNNGWETNAASYYDHALIQAGKDLAVRASGFGMPGLTVDGNDVFAVYKAAKYCIDNARAGKGPSLLECVTYRQRCHNESYTYERAVDTYLSHEVNRWPYNNPDELKYWLARDPIPRFEKIVSDGKLLTADELANTKKNVEAEIEEALTFTLASPYPDPEVEFKYIREVFKA